MEQKQFHFQFYGPEDGTPLVFLHGLMGFAQNWRRIISHFEGQFRCLAYDQRGHGRSFKPDSGYTPEDYAQDLLEIIDSQGWSQIHLVGHSMGARNALCFAALHPQRLKSLVMVDMGPEEYRVAFQYYEDLLNLVPTPFQDRASAKAFLFEEFTKKAQSKEDPLTLANYFYANLEEKPSGEIDWKFSKKAIIDSVKAGRGKNRWNEVESLEMPTLLIRGQRSLDLPRDVYEEMLRRQPLIKGVEIVDAGHWVHSDKPLETIQALEAFWQQISL